MAAQHGPQSAQDVEAVVARPLAELDLDLEAVEVSTAGRRRVVRVLVDSDTGVDLDQISDASRAVGRALDEDDVLGERPYTLEVTSPGVDRPLTLPRHWRRNVGRLVRVALTDGTRLVGRVREAGEHAAVLDVEAEPREVGYGDVAKAKVEIEFNRPGKE